MQKIIIFSFDLNKLVIIFELISEVLETTNDALDSLCIIVK